VKNEIRFAAARDGSASERQQTRKGSAGSLLKTRAVGEQMAREVRVETQDSEQEATVTSLQAAQLAANAGLDKKAEDVRVLDIRGLASYADFLVLMSAGSDRQVNAIADAVDDVLRKNEYRPIGVEGLGAGSWILIDAVDIVVHVFQADAREFYDLDSLWADAKRVKVDVAPRAPAAAPVA
jgi:ribosome-associated protein